MFLISLICSSLPSDFPHSAFTISFESLLRAFPYSLCSFSKQSHPTKLEKTSPPSLGCGVHTFHGEFHSSVPSLSPLLSSLKLASLPTGTQHQHIRKSKRLLLRDPTSQKEGLYSWAFTSSQFSSLFASWRSNVKRLLCILRERPTILYFNTFMLIDF